MTGSSVSVADLAGLSLFEGADPTGLGPLAALSERREIAEGEVLYRQGEPASTIYWVEAGQVGLRVDHDGHSTLVMMVRPGDVLGWAALEENATSLTTARAMSPVRLIALPAEALLDLLASGSPATRRVIRRLFGMAAAHLDGTRDQLLRPGSEGVITAG